MAGSGTLTVTTPSDREIQMTRVFNAPRELVFAALTRPELLKRWFQGPPGWTLVECEYDARPGGRYRYVWRNADGTEMGLGGTITEIVRPERVVATEKFDQAWYAGGAVNSFVLTEAGGKTTATLTVRYDSKEIRDQVLQTPMAQGVEMSYDQLAEWLASPEAATAGRGA